MTGAEVRVVFLSFRCHAHFPAGSDPSRAGRDDCRCIEAVVAQS